LNGIEISAIGWPIKFIMKWNRFGHSFPFHKSRLTQ
jgi:hypothetical protein